MLELLLKLEWKPLQAKILIFKIMITSNFIAQVYDVYLTKEQYQFFI